MDTGVELAQKFDGGDVLATAVLVGDPIAIFAGVVQVQHGSDRIHAKTVDVIGLHPEQRRGQEEIGHLVAPKVEDQRAPVAMFALARIGMFVQMRAIEKGEPRKILGEVRRDPIEDHAHAFLVEVVHEELEIFGRSEPAGGREVPGGLVSPRTIEGMFGDGQELHMGEAGFLHVFGEFGRQFAVVQEALVVFRNAGPGTQVDFVDGDRLAQRIDGLACVHPVGVVPLKIQVADAGAGAGAILRGKGVRVGFFHPIIVHLRHQVELVGLPNGGAAHEALPNTPLLAFHQMGVGVPTVEVADHRDATRVGRPDREGDALHPLVGARMGAEFFPDPFVITLAMQMDVEAAENRILECAHRMGSLEGRRQTDSGAVWLPW